MKFTIERSTLIRALSHGQSVVEKRTTVPVLTHVLITASKQGVSFATTDIDLALIETVKADVQREGSLCIPAGMLYDIARKLNDKSPVVLEVQEGKNILNLTSGRSIFNISGLEAQEFPALALVPLTHQFVIPAKALRNLLEMTKFCMSTEETRYHLNGILLHMPEKNLRAVATDMHRLAYADYLGEIGSINDFPEVIVSRKTIVELLKLLEGVEGGVTVGLSESRIEVNLEAPESQAVLTSRLIDGLFPDYGQALSVQHAHKIIAPTKELSKALDRVGTVVNEKHKAVKVVFQRNKMLLSAVSHEFGSAVEEVDIDFPHEQPIDICFNVRYLLEIMDNIPTDEVEICLTDQEVSIAIQPAYQPSVPSEVKSCFIVMPLRG